MLGFVTVVFGDWWTLGLELVWEAAWYWADVFSV